MQLMRPMRPMRHQPNRSARQTGLSGRQRCDNGVCVSNAKVLYAMSPSVRFATQPRVFALGAGCETTEDCAPGKTCEEGRCLNNRLSPCSSSDPCVSGTECIEGVVSPCVAPADHTACTVFEYCMTPDMVPIAPMAAFTNYCFPNLCNPGGDAFGVFQDTPYNAPCDVVEEGVAPVDTLDLSARHPRICTDFQGQLGLGESCIPMHCRAQLKPAWTGSAPSVLGGTCSQLCNDRSATCQTGARPNCVFQALPKVSGLRSRFSNG